MTKVLYVGDVHLSLAAPGRRTSTYYHDILAKFDHVVRIAAEQKVDMVAFVGDIYHNPRAHRVQHELTKAVSVRMRALGVPVVVLPGNHDIHNGDLDGAYVTQPIALLDEIANVTLLQWEPVVVGDVVFHPVPGVPHAEVPPEAYALRENFPDKFQVQLVHQSIARDGAGSMIFEHVGAEELVAAYGTERPDLVVYGHLHAEYGLYEIDGVRFANFGSICRGSIDESDLNKVPKVMIAETSGTEWVGFELFELEHRPAADVFLLEEYLEEKEKSRDMEDFVASIERISVQKFSLDGVISSIEQRDDVEANVRAYTVDCINKARA